MFARIALVLASAAACLAQEFDAASVKRAAIARAGGEGARRSQINVTPTSLTMINVSLTAAIEWAYSARPQQVSGSGWTLPGWTIDDRYDIAGKSGHPVSRDEMRRMLRTLLADRFKLELAREARTMAVCDLARGRKPLALRASSGDGPATLGVADGGFVFERTSMAELAERLSGIAGIARPVFDKTGVEGSFDFTLAGAAAAAREDDYQGIADSLERLGLKLESRKGPVEMLVIRRAERPSAN